MSVELIFQKDEETSLIKKIKDAFERKPKKVYFFCGLLKETGFRLIEEEFIDSGAKLYFAIGIDKKNTTRNMLESILLYTKDIYVYSNNNGVEFDSNVCIFEYNNKSEIYMSSSNMSEGGLQDNISIFSKYDFDLNDKDNKIEYKKLIKELLSDVEEKQFVKLTKQEIEKLVEEKEIFTTRQYNHNVQSIAELLGKPAVEKKVQTKEEIDDVFVSDIQIPKIDLSNISLDMDDIDISNIEEYIHVPSETKKEELEVNVDDYKETEYEGFDEEKTDSSNVDEENELYDESLIENIEDNDVLDIGNMLLEKANIKLDIDKTKKEKALKKEEVDESENDEIDEFSETEVVKVKKVNLNNITNYIYELPSKAQKGQDINTIKIPNYIKNTIPEFFELAEKGKNVTVNGVNYKQRDIKLEIIDVKNNIKYNDNNAIMKFKKDQSYMSIITDTIKNINYEENDIMRIIKLSSDVYHIEVISKDLQEYKIWDKLCVQKFKATTRKYGMM